MISDETQIQMFADCRVTTDNRQNLDYHVVVVIRRLWTDKNCPAENTWPSHVKSEQHIGSKKNYGSYKKALTIMIQGNTTA